MIIPKHYLMWFVALTSIVLVATGCHKTSAPVSYNTALLIGQQKIMVEVAATDKSRQQGLSGRTELTDDQGMLFQFQPDEDVRPGFWMKDMNFALDFIWINHGRVVGLIHNVPAPQPGSTTPLPIYYPPADVDQVLEVDAGWSARHNISVGDTVSLQNK